MAKKSQLDNILSAIDSLLETPMLPFGEEMPDDRSRVSYNFHSSDLSGRMYLQRQILDDNGQWQWDVVIPMQDFLAGKISYMNENDFAVARDISRAMYRSNGRYAGMDKAECIFPHLAGQDRVYIDFKPVTIKLVKPTVTFTMDNDKLNYNVNICQKNNSNVFYWRDAQNQYSVVDLSPVQNAILTTLKRNGSYPLSAMKEVVKLCDKLSDWFTVKTKFEDISEYPVIEGNSMIFVKMHERTKGFYWISTYVRPVENYHKDLRPGDGPEEFLYNEGNGTCLVKRDLSSERNKYIKLWKELKQISSSQLFKNEGLIDQQGLLTAMEYMHDKPDEYIMEWPEGQKLSFKGRAQTPADPFRINYEMNWFEVEGNISIGGQQYNLKEAVEIAKTMDENGYVRIDESTYARMTKALQEEILGLNDISNGGNQIRVSKFQVGKLAEFIRQSGLGIKVSEELKEQEDKMKRAYDMTPEVPNTLNATLREYQKQGYEWMARLAEWDAGACLADDMGLGKTIQAITLMLNKASDGASLVVVPKALTLNWASEIKRFAPSLVPYILNDARNKQDVVEKAGPGDIVICTYNLLTTCEEILKAKEWNIICLDEAHYIKNRSTKMSQAAMELNGKHRLIMTGTPVQNHMGELWNLFQFLNPGILGTYESFRGTISSDEGKEKVRKTVLPFILRRTKEEVLSELPTKSEIDWMVQLSTKELSYYEALRTSVQMNILSGGGTGNKVDLNMLQGLTKLRLLACYPALTDPQWFSVQSKIRDLMKLIEIIDIQKNPVLVFSQFTSFLSLVKVQFNRKGYDYCYIDGSTSTTHRQEAVDSFQKGEKKIFISSIKAGGIGLTLTAATHVIILDPWWNPAVENQAMDRAHRIGQEHDVTVIRMISSNTIEEKILRLHEMKRQISDDILKGAGGANKLTYEDVKELVSSF